MAVLLIINLFKGLEIVNVILTLHLNILLILEGINLNTFLFCLLLRQVCLLLLLWDILLRRLFLFLFWEYWHSIWSLKILLYRILWYIIRISNYDIWRLWLLILILRNNSCIHISLVKRRWQIKWLRECRRRNISSIFLFLLFYLGLWCIENATIAILK